MWTVMMIAMMLPAASPFVLAFATVQRKRTNDQVYGPVSIFLMGYFFIWTAFSGLTALAQQALRGAALLSPTLTSTSAIFAGGLLVAAGIYQWTPLKNACLLHCRSALGFVLAEWREGAWGAFLMGVEHGIFCLGCCWALMALPFAAGVMNLFWMAAITVFILIEKAAPAGEWVGRVAGGALIAWGGWMITAAIR
jgi:predicted metal-binding membrane protein